MVQYLSTKAATAVDQGGMEIVERSVFRVTRDADFEVSDDADDLLEAVEQELQRRRFGDAVRLEVSTSTSRDDASAPGCQAQGRRRRWYVSSFLASRINADGLLGSQRDQTPDVADTFGDLFDGLNCKFESPPTPISSQETDKSQSIRILSTKRASRSIAAPTRCVATSPS